jgi:hypothetical protein
MKAIKVSILTDNGAISVASMTDGKIIAHGKRIVAHLVDGGATYRKAILQGYDAARLAFNR